MNKAAKPDKVSYRFVQSVQIRISIDYKQSPEMYTRNYSIVIPRDYFG